MFFAHHATGCNTKKRCRSIIISLDQHSTALQHFLTQLDAGPSLINVQKNNNSHDAECFFWWTILIQTLYYTQKTRFLPIVRVNGTKKFPKEVCIGKKLEKKCELTTK